MGDVVAFRQRDPYLREIEEMLARPVDEPFGCEVRWTCADRKTAGVLSRRVRSEVKRRGWPVTVRQFHEHVFAWQNLTPEEEELVMRAIGAAASSLLDRVMRPHPVPDPPSR